VAGIEVARAGDPVSGWLGKKLKQVKPT
jgi:hypothetical protein